MSAQSDHVNRTPLFALMSARAVSSTGNQLALVTIPWYVLQTTGSPARVGAAGAIEAIGMILSSFLGGAIIDRVGFRRSSVLADSTAGVAIALIPLLDRLVGLAFWQLLLLILCTAVFNMPGTTARRGMLPELAELARMPLERVNSVDEGIANFASLAGPLLAGFLIALVSARNVLWLDAVSFAYSAAVVLLLVPTIASHTVRERIPYVKALREGIQFLKSERVVLTVASIGSYVNFVGAALMAVVLPVFASRVFDSSVALGVLVAADGGGALIGTILFGVTGHRWPRRGAMIVAFVVSFLALAGLVTTPGLLVSSALLLIDGAAFGIIGPLIWTIYQERVPSDLRGRVFGSIMAVHRSATPLGVLLAGYAMQFLSLTGALAAVALLSLLMPLMVVAAPSLRSMDHPTDGYASAATRHEAGERLSG
jgi:MFS family permease